MQMGHTQQVPVNIQMQSNMFYSPLSTNQPQLRSMGAPNQVPIMPANPASYAPILWYYPTPPVSPSSALYLHSSPLINSYAGAFVLIVKNAPPNITVQDVLLFFSGYEVHLAFNLIYYL